MSTLLSTLSRKLRSLFRYRRAFKNWPVAAAAGYLGERLGQERVLHCRNGSQVLIRPGIDRVALGEIFVTDNYSPCLGLRDVRHVWDVGGNIGCFAIWAYGHYPQAQFHSFEPCPTTFERLEKNRELNPQIDWQLHPIGLSNVNDTVQGFTGEYSDVAGQFTTGGTPFQMKLRRAQEVWEELGRPRIDILKVDCEGGEYGILRDLDGEVLDRVRVVILEYHAVPGQSPETLREILTRHGFQFDWPGGELNVVVARHPE
ncbi:MAG: hypothetical protein QOE70_988 [Chthoniobacter sp.]|jgi:FkbM family methyltransferase|nr:hypothetical protein [Chthoniobacter sp.]